MDEITEGQVVSYFQGMSCEGACAHAHVRNPFLKVCGMCVHEALFWACDVRLHFCTLLHTFWDKIARKCYFLTLKRF